MKYSFLLALFCSVSIQAAEFTVGPTFRRPDHIFHHHGSGVSVAQVSGKYVMTVTSYPSVMLQYRLRLKGFYSDWGIGLIREETMSPVNLCVTNGYRKSKWAIGWTHCSNGNTRLPNKGTDFVGLTWITR